MVDFRSSHTLVSMHEGVHRRMCVCVCLFCCTRTFAHTKPFGSCFVVPWGKHCERCRPPLARTACSLGPGGPWGWPRGESRQRRCRGTTWKPTTPSRGVERTTHGTVTAYVIAVAIGFAACHRVGLSYGVVACHEFAAICGVVTSLPMSPQPMMLPRPGAVTGSL